MYNLLIKSHLGQKQKIRELTTDELELISGGHDGEHEVTKKEVKGGTEYSIDAKG